MTIDLDKLRAEGLLPLSEAAADLSGRLDTSTMTRWCRAGLLGRDGNRHRLECVKVGARFFTTKAAVNRFLVHLTLGGLANAAPTNLLLPTAQELANVG